MREDAERGETWKSAVVVLTSYPILTILLQTAATAWCQVPHTRNKKRFFIVRGLEIRNLNLFLDPLTVSDPNFQKW